MSFPCVYCNQEVRPRQHAVKCDDCSQWQHRNCNTGISLADYRRMMQEDLDIIFQCCKCMPTELPSEDAMEEDQQIEEERDVTGVDILEASLGDLPDAAEESIQDHSFNISADIQEENPVVESDIEDEEPTDSYIEDRPTTYQIVDGGTKRQGKKLISSDGYCYTVKTSSERSTLWRCTVRNKTTNCKATVVQRGQTYVTGINPHIHPNDPGSFKKTKIRVEVFNRLKELIPDARVEAFCMDFESGAWAAVKSVYPTADIKGCSFHWTQAVMRKVAELGLKAVYNQKKSTHNFIRKLLALTFLPAAHIRPTFLELLQTTANACQQLKELMAYLSRTWFTSTVWSVQQWSVYQQPVRTNNDVEGWHRRFNQRAGRTQMHFYRIVPAFMKEAKTVQLQHRLVSEQQLTRYQRVQYRQMQGRITVLWERLDAKTLKTSDFLKEVSSLYAPALPANLPASDYSDSE